MRNHSDSRIWPFSVPIEILVSQSRISTPTERKCIGSSSNLCPGRPPVEFCEPCSRISLSSSNSAVIREIAPSERPVRRQVLLWTTLDFCAGPAEPAHGSRLERASCAAACAYAPNLWSSVHILLAEGK